MVSVPESPDPDESLPDQLRQLLRQSDDMPFQLQPEDHERILRTARTQLTIPVVRHRRRWIAATAAVSTVCAGLLIAILLPRDTPSADQLAAHSVNSSTEILSMAVDAETPAVDPHDIDASGVVDILDAWTLSRQLQQGVAEPAWDLNADGQLDERDVQLVAIHAVTL